MKKDKKSNKKKSCCGGSCHSSKNGKGDSDRVSNFNKFQTNYDLINWDSVSGECNKEKD